MNHIIKICLFGPESTGKSSLAARLAEHYQTCFVPEYAKSLIEQQAGQISLDDISKIAQGQIDSEDRMLQSARQILFCDTDLITTTIWSNWLFGECPEWIKAEADRRKYDLYLLLNVDVPWLRDVHRYLPNDRQNFYDVCKHALEQRHITYVAISGEWEHRFQMAVAAINQLLNKSCEKDRGVKA